MAQESLISKITQYGTVLADTRAQYVAFRDQAIVTQDMWDAKIAEVDVQLNALNTVLPALLEAIGGLG